MRGTGETRPSDGRTRRSSATSLSSTELMLGGTLVGGRLRGEVTIRGNLGSPDAQPSPAANFGGDLEIDSEIGVGTEVRIILPLAHLADSRVYTVDFGQAKS